MNKKNMITIYASSASYLQMKKMLCKKRLGSERFIVYLHIGRIEEDNALIIVFKHVVFHASSSFCTHSATAKLSLQV